VQPPILNLPPTTRWTIAALTVVWLLDVATNHMLTGLFAFRGIHDARSIVTMGSYGLVHADLAHLAMNLVGVAVLGKVLEPRIGGRRLLLLLLIGTAAGAAVHAAIDHGYLIGISAGVGALYGTALPAARNGRFGAFDRLIVLLAMLFVLVSLAGLLLPIMPGVAHAAHLGGFLAGLLLSHRLLP